MTDQFQYASIMAETNTDPAHLNLRNDQPSVIQLTSEDLFCVYSRYGNASDPSVGGLCTLYGMFSINNGQSWEAPFEILAITGNEINYGASLYLQNNGNIVLLFNQQISSNWWLKKAVSTDEGLTFSDVTTIHTFTKKMSSAPDRILKLSSGTLLYATSERTNDENSPLTATNNGRLFYSLDDGETWVNTNLNIQSADQSCQEPGVFEKNGIVYFYWRSDRTFYQKYVTLSESDLFSTYSAEKDFGFFNPSATMAIKYDSVNDVFWAAKHEVYKKVATTQTDEADRVYLELYASRRDVTSWHKVAEIDYEYARYFFEPSILFIQDQLLITYSRYIPYNGGWMFDMLSRRIPMAACLPMLNGREQMNHLDIVYKQPFWQNDVYGTGGNGKQPQFITMGFDKYSRQDAYHDFVNNLALKYNAFAPEEKIRTFGSIRGVNRWVDMSQMHKDYPHQSWYYSLNGSGIGFNGNQLIERHLLGTPSLPANNLHEVYANGRYKFFERVQVGVKSQAEITAFGQVEDGQIIINNSTTPPKAQIRLGGVWRNIALEP